MNSLIQLFIQLEWNIHRRYPLRILFNIIHLLMILCLFFFISQTLGEIPFLQGSYFPFVATGLCFHSFFSGILNASPSKILEWRDIGVLESLAMSPKPLWKLFSSAGSYEMLMAIGKSTLILIGVLSITQVHFKPLIFVSTLFLTFILSLILSLISTCSFLLWKRVSLIESGGSLFAIFLSGVYFPIDVLPSFLRLIAYINPVFHGLFLLRQSLGIFSPDTSFFSTQDSFLIILAWIFVSSLFVFWFYRKTTYYILKNNSLSHL